MARLAAVFGVAWPVVAGVGLSAATFLLFRAYAVLAVEATGRDRATAHHRQVAQYAVVPVAAVAATAVFVVSVRGYLRTASVLAATAGTRAGPDAVLFGTMVLWGATVVAAVLAGIRGYAPLAGGRERDATSLADGVRTVASAVAFAGLLAAVAALLVVEPLAAAAAVAVGRPAVAAASPYVVAAIERTRPLPDPWAGRVLAIADRTGASLGGARVVANADEVRVVLAGLVPGRQVLFVTDRALATLGDEPLGALVVRELTGAARRGRVGTLAVETVPVALWLASFAVLARGQAILVGVLLLAPYAAAVGLVGQRATYAADDAAAAAVGREPVVRAIERAASANDVVERRHRLFDLLAAAPAPRRRVERLRAGDPGADDAAGRRGVDATAERAAADDREGAGDEVDAPTPSADGRSASDGGR